MPSLRQRIFPIPPSKNCDLDGEDDDFDAEYSFAAVYSGPPVGYDIPQAIPVDFDRIPTASVLSKSTILSNFPLPVIQPIVDGDNPGKSFCEEFILGSEIASCSDFGEFDDSGAVRFLDSIRVSFPSPDGAASSGTLGFSDDLQELSERVSTPANGDPVKNPPKELILVSEIAFSSDFGEIDDSGAVQFLDCTTVSLPSPGGEASSNSLGFSDDSQELSGSSNEERLSSAANSSQNPIVNESTVTFHDPESRFMEDSPPQVQLLNKTSTKKGLCNRCQKRNRFSEKETCIVCEAKYCADCVLRAMGSMPEGRKCVACIGSRIDESKRGNLGRSSRLLRQLLSNSEVKQIMNSELSCEANQVPPELVYVNDKPLCHEELVLLQSCPNPPKKLKAGKYWYDKVCGYWGKDGEKPCQIITAQLGVGDAIKRNASNGNTNVLVNNREITKSELRMLQWAGIRCEGCPSFWVSADGSCLEEGQKNVMGRLWDKKGSRLVCTFLSLPIPPDCGGPSGEEVDSSTNATTSNFTKQKQLNKILLVGCDNSGASTIFKQARMTYNVSFSADERLDIKHMIQSRLYGYLGILLEGREQFEEESLETESSDEIVEEGIYSISPRMKAFCDWLLQVMISGNLEIIFPAASREYAPLVEELWKDRSLQATYSRRNELHRLPRVASYFLDRAVEISRGDYEPSDTDILYCEGITSSNGIASMEFSFPNPAKHSLTDAADQNDPLHRYQLIKVHESSLGENCKWIDMFEDVDLVMFCVSLTDYDQFSEDDTTGVSTNKMLASKALFEKIVTHPKFQDKEFLLVLNKFDLLEEKIEQSPLTQCEWFQDFNPVVSVYQVVNVTNPSLAQRAFHYVAVQFKRLFCSLTDRKLFVSLTTALEPDSVDEALRYAREIIKWGEEKPRSGSGSGSGHEWSTGSMEEATSSS